MKFIIERENLIKSLQHVSILSNKRQTLPILNNLLLQVVNNTLLLTSTDLEIEIVASIVLSLPCQEGKITVSSRKFFDICRGLSIGSKIEVQLKNEFILIYSGRSRFSLSTLSADNFPNLQTWKSEIEFTLSQSTMKYLIEKTQSFMACQDIRYYLNGMLFEVEKRNLRTVATDGYRLAICSVSIETILPNYSIIIPRRGIVELMRILDENDTLIRIQISRNNICIYIKNFVFFSKLIEGSFPDYRRILPKNPEKILKVDCNSLKKAFSRVAVLSNERMNGAYLYINNNQLKIISNNFEKEEAEETLDVICNMKTKIEICLNINYMLDILNALKCNYIHIFLTDSISSVQIEDIDSKRATYVIMPMRL